jgi:hypothetical protein
MFLIILRINRIYLFAYSNSWQLTLWLHWMPLLRVNESSSIWWGHDHAWRITWRPRRSARASKSRRRPKTYPVRVTKVEAQIKFESTSEFSTSLPWTGHPGRVRTPFFMIHIWMESLFDKEANSSGLTSKYVQNQQESSKQVTVQNLSGRCVAVFWADWPCIMSGLKPKLWAPNPWSFPTLGRVLDYKHSRHRY